MTTTYPKTAIALQGGGALGAYSFGALKYIYESEPNLQLSSISGFNRCVYRGGGHSPSPRKRNR
jgi:hypothetical protein